MNRNLNWAAYLLLLVPSAAFGQNTWSVETAGPRDMTWGAMVAGRDALYLVGGQPQSSQPTANLNRFDPLTGAWNDLAPVPGVGDDGRYNSVFYNCASYVASDAGDFIYSFGNSYWNVTLGNRRGQIYRYSVAADAWTLLGTLTDRRWYAQCAQVDGRIYIFGGYASGEAYATIEEFDPATETLTVRPPLDGFPPLWRHAVAADPATNRIHITGGTDHFEYDPAAHAIRRLAGLPTAPSAHASFVLQGRTFVMGGDPASGETWEYNAQIDTWVRRADLVTARSGLAAATLGGLGYVYGGGTATLERYEPFVYGPAPRSSWVRQMSGHAILPVGGYAASTVTFDAQVDIAARLEVRCRRTDEIAWTCYTGTNLGPTDPAVDSSTIQGRIQLTLPLDVEGGYEWEFRVASFTDVYEDPEWTPYAGEVPHFIVDLQMPGAPVPLAPSGDTNVDGPREGDVHFTWQPAADAVAYVVRVSDVADLSDLLAKATVEEAHAVLRLPTSRSPRYWDVIALDRAGNQVGAPVTEFRVVHDDGFRHAAGDGKPTCGFGAATGGSILLVLAAIAAATFSSAARAWAARRPSTCSRRCAT